ncbi:MAG: hypothetical protein AUK47_00260 [Deltaproteobacteria bacterium CG2_30_63_29]|nr:MAG: hypothetical protein AUK47_00260 [Deltaproteobacteria bacterium CG2_30_63_29]PIW00635.1 MAG: hypothetical protein COW42_07180 [Deltaproteobacteria bacterium CG17_big_fil_post_rev_8_21_14_2_50_63_7]PJB35722.1 MAG: hypothetical protein CO108_24945 [Deltaproteobacteria bacterium CG_4_9_14_3_um_filter_63_12]
MKHWRPNFEFPWRTLNAIIGGASAIDVPCLYLNTLEEAEEFLACYGYHWSKDEHRAEIEWIRSQAVEFIEGSLLVDTALQIPKPLVQQRDVRTLLLWASRSRHAQPGDRDQQWTCALLRVMHTMAHAQTYFNRRFGEQIREQILAPFRPHLHGSPDRPGGMTLGEAGADAIPIVGFDVKHTKPLSSVVMKLLLKAENVAVDIFDRVGVRFVTQERFDTLLVVHYLRTHNIIMFANIKPSRSRNTLIDLEWLRAEMKLANDAAEPLSKEEWLHWLRRVSREGPLPELTVNLNPLSATDYRSVQFTCRQLIRLQDPCNAELLEVLEECEARLGPDDPLVESLRLRCTHEKEIRFFFPFEVQILDQSSFSDSRTGRSSYDEYKTRQVKVAQRRVLGPLLDNLPDS